MLGATRDPKKRDELEEVVLEGVQWGPEWGPTGAGQGMQMLSTGIDTCEVHWAAGRTSVL